MAITKSGVRNLANEPLGHHEIIAFIYVLMKKIILYFNETQNDVVVYRSLLYRSCKLEMLSAYCLPSVQQNN